MSRPGGNFIRKAIFVGLPLTLVLVALVFLVSAYWLLNTSSGAAWLWSNLEGSGPVDLKSSQVTGDLATGFTVNDMEYRSESLDLSVRSAEIVAGLGWWPLTIEVDKLVLTDVQVHARSSGDPESGVDGDEDFRNTLAGFELPLPLQINGVFLNGISLQQDDDPPRKLAESVRFKAALDDRLDIDQLDILAAGLETKLLGHFRFEPPFELAATLEGRFEKAGEAGETLFEMPFRLACSGDLEKLLFDLTSQKFGLRLDGELLDPVANPTWNAKAKMDHFEWPADQVEPDYTFSNLNVVSQGNIENWSFALDSGLALSQLQGIHLALSGSGSTSAVTVNEGTVSGPGVDLVFDGTLDWSRQPGARLKGNIGQLDLSPWVADWPAGEKLAGDLELNWSGNRLEIPESQLTVLGTRLEVGIAADIDIGSNSVNGQLDWSNLRWPLKSEQAEFASESGSFKISGSVDDWLADGQLMVQTGAYPQGRFDIRGSGTRTSASIQIPGGQILGGTVSGEADVDWADELRWNAAVQTRGIDPEPILSGWPGQLDSEFELHTKGHPQHIELRLLELQGVLRDVPIFAQGSLSVNESDVTFRSLEARTDEAVLNLDGSPVDRDGVKVRFNGSLPSAWLQGARGSLELEGRYSNHATWPALELELQGLNIYWNELSVSNLAISTPGPQTTTGLPALQLDATEITLEDLKLDEISISVNPVDDEVELKADLLGEGIALSSMINMVNKGNGSLFDGPWQGELADLELAVGPAYLFKLARPAQISWSSGSASLGPLCLSENVDATLCLGFDYKNNGDWSLVADATAIPLDYLRDYFEMDVHFEQVIQGHMEWHQLVGQAPTGGADFQISAGRVLDLVDNDVLTETKEGQIAFKLQNGNLESGVLDIEFPGTGFIDVGFDVLDIMEGGARKIQGRAITRLDHFKLAGQLALPGVDAVDGQFESNILLGGSVADPELDGTFKFSNGFVHYAPLGLQIEDIELEGQVKRRDLGNLTGRFRAGEGVASLTGRFQFEDMESASLDVGLAGEQLLLINTEELKVFTNTDLQFTLGPERVDINGQVTIPSARLNPSELQLGGARDSEDLVIETAGMEAEPVAVKAAEKSRVYGSLEVVLGDDVVVTVPGVETSITGSTKFNWNGDPIPMAEGGYTLKGIVDVYGPRLTITNGSISFPSVPADNPTLNIRAGRDIFGNTQIRRAGVRVTGNLKRPVLEAYTVPVTNEDRAWTLLVTGTDFDQAQGISGFDVGTYIAPRLYVSYGISLFEDENVISVRYDLKKGFGVKVTSGQRETGVDVSYTIEK